jgi:hypothetical protein
LVFPILWVRVFPTPTLKVRIEDHRRKIHYLKLGHPFLLNKTSRCLLM